MLEIIDNLTAQAIKAKDECKSKIIELRELKRAATIESDRILYGNEIHFWSGREWELHIKLNELEFLKIEALRSKAKES